MEIQHFVGRGEMSREMSVWRDRSRLVQGMYSVTRSMLWCGLDSMMEVRMKRITMIDSTLQSFKAGLVLSELVANQ